MINTTWHTLPLPEVLTNLQTDATNGLDEIVVARRLAEHDPNDLIERGGKSPGADVKCAGGCIRIENFSGRLACAPTNHCSFLSPLPLVYN